MAENKCDQCRLWSEQGASFCGGCGHDLRGYNPDGLEESDNPLYNVFVGISTACALIILLLALAFIFLNFDSVLRGLTDRGTILFCIGLVTVILSLVFALYTSFRAGKKQGNRADNLATSGVAGFGMGLAVILGVSYVYIFMTLAFQQNISTEIFDKYSKYQLSALLMLAGPEEEFLYRLLPVGLPMVILGYITRRKNSWKYVLGGFGTPKAAWALIVISAVAFGFAHLDSWNLVKVPQAALSGIIFGYLYCEYGIYVSILAHSTLDCITVAGYIIGTTGSSLMVMLLMLCGIVILAIALINIYKNGIRLEGWMGGELTSGIRNIWDRH